MENKSMPSGLSSFNQAIAYIEAQLEEGVDPLRLGQIAGCPAGLFGRIFSVLGGMPLGEYIRLRKLSKAAYDLKDGQEKIIDLSLKYGYESADAFTAAFKRFHNATPTEVRSGVKFQFLPPIHFSFQIKGGQYMNIRMEKKDRFYMAGLAILAHPESKFSQTWLDLFEQYPEEKLVALGSGQSFGACYDMSQDGSFRYMAGFGASDPAQARALGLEVLEVPAAQYAVVQLHGPVPQCIHEGWEYVMGTFFPQEGFRHAGTPDFEVYHQGDLHSTDYTMELWVPVEKA